MHIVVCAAMKLKDGTVVTGVRHTSPDMRSVMKRIFGPGYHRLVVEQGFLDNRGNFLTREEAWKVADRAGQIRRLDSKEFLPSPREAGVGDEGTLYSENLY